MIDRLALNSGGLKSREGWRAGVVMNSSPELIALAQTGDQEAFRLLFERYARPVLVFIYNLVGRHDVAEELTQETFVRAYSNLKELLDEAKFSTWLFGIARNVVREWTRSRARGGWTSWTDANLIPDAQESNTSPAQQLIERELNGAIIMALQSLDEDRRIVFALKIFQGSSYREIMDITGFSLAKVKTELHRARGEMRRRLKRYVEIK